MSQPRSLCHRSISFAPISIEGFVAEQWQSLYDTLNELVIKYPDARIVAHYELDESKTCPNFSVRDYLLHENIKNYEFQDGLTDEADLAELDAEDIPELEEDD